MVVGWAGRRVGGLMALRVGPLTERADPTRHTLWPCPVCIRARTDRLTRREPVQAGQSNGWLETTAGTSEAVHVAVVTSGGAILFLAAETNAEAMMEPLVGFVERSASAMLWPRDATEVHSLLCVRAFGSGDRPVFRQGRRPLGLPAASSRGRGVGMKVHRACEPIRPHIQLVGQPSPQPPDQSDNHSDHRCSTDPDPD